MPRLASAIEIWHPAALRGAMLLKGELSHHTFPRHTHDELVIGINIRGAHTFWCRQRVHEVSPGTIALVNPGEVHTGRVLGDSGWDYRAFYLSPGFLAAAVEGLELPGGRGSEFPNCVVADRAVAEALALAHAVLASPTSDVLEQESRAVEALGCLIERHAAQCPPRAALELPAVARVHDFVRSEYRRTIRLHELQDIAGVGKYKLIAAFRAAYGQPPYEMVTTHRVADARRRLARGESIARVAASVGFTDQSHLNRQFKRIVGVTPGQYARAFN